MEEQKHIGQLIVDYLLEGEDNETTNTGLMEWLAESERNRIVFEQYKKIWEESLNYMDIESFDAELAWEKVNHINQKKAVRNRKTTHLYYTLSGIAASALILFSLSFMGLFTKESPNTTVSIDAAYGSRSDIVLPDGSRVKLNSGSALTYTYNMQTNLREVKFQGEGFFDVSKSKIPFIVKMPHGLEIKVLGTSFNLRSYTEDDKIEASLIEGSIELNHNTDKLLLKPGEMAAFDKKTNQLQQINGVLSHTYGWVDNKLYMDNMSLSEVCRQMERWYNVNITLQKELGESIHYDGVIQEESIMDVMEALSRLSKIKYHVKGKNISITSK